MHFLFQNAGRFVRSNEIEQAAREDSWKCESADSVNPSKPNDCQIPHDRRDARHADSDTLLESGVLVVHVCRFPSNGHELG